MSKDCSTVYAFCFFGSFFPDSVAIFFLDDSSHNSLIILNNLQNHLNKWIEIHLDWNIIQFEVLLDFNDIT